jgi:predicted O-methyltransferase YrrM
MNFEELTFLFKSDVSNRGICRMDFDEAACLYRAVKRQQPKRVVEIGRAGGGSTLILASAMPKDSHLVSIDLHPLENEITKYHLLKQDLHVELIVGNSRGYYWWPDSEVNLLFIDGDHTYEGAKHDHEHYGQFVPKGGFIIHHDMGKARPNALNDSRLIQLKNEIIESGEYKIIDQAGSLIVFEKQ